MRTRLLVAALCLCACGPLEPGEELEPGAVEQDATAARSAFMIGTFGGLRIPASGAYWGADDGERGFTGSKGIETQLGRGMAIRNRHYQWNGGSPAYPAAALKGDLATGAIAMISQAAHAGFPCKKSDGHGCDTHAVGGHTGMDRITAGEFDADLRRAFRELKALGKPVIYRLFMEMNGAHNPYYLGWQGGGTAGAGTFIKAWRHIYGLARAEQATLDTGGNVLFVYCPQSYQKGTNAEWKQMYPGDPYVDIYGLDIYRSTFREEADNAGAGKDHYAFAKAHQKPFMVAEGGFEQGQVEHAEGTTWDKDGSVTSRSLITSMRNELKGSYPNVFAYVTWNLTGPIGTNYVDTSTKSLTQYRQWVTDPYFLLGRH